MIRRPLFASLVLAAALLGACGGDDGLVVRGSVEVEAADLQTGFAFPDEVRLDGPGAEGNINGACTLTELDDGEYGITVDIVRGFDAEPQGLASLTVMHRSDDEQARVEVELGATPYVSVDGSCALEVDYVSSDGGVVGLTGSCDLEAADGATANAVLGLDLAGCEVVAP